MKYFVLFAGHKISYATENDALYNAIEMSKPDAHNQSDVAYVLGADKNKCTLVSVTWINNTVYAVDFIM